MHSFRWERGSSSRSGQPQGTPSDVVRHGPRSEGDPRPCARASAASAIMAAMSDPKLCSDHLKNGILRAVQRAQPSPGGIFGPLASKSRLPRTFSSWSQR